MDKVQKFTPKSEEEIREQVIQDYQLADSDENKSFIDKAVEKELNWQNEKIENHKKLSKAIEQKIKLRDSLKETDDEDEDGEPKPKGETPKDDDKLSKLEKEVEELKTSQHRQKYPNLTDEEYRSINALAKENGKSFEDTVANNPLVKPYFENSEARERLNGATTAPSNRTNATQVKTEDEKIADELDRDLPPGFSSKKA